MIDISGKEEVMRIATASGKILLKTNTLEKIKRGEIKKGDPITVAKVAAIQAVKHTPDIIPMCHNISITGIDIVSDMGKDFLSMEVTVKAIAKTGVEMEALVGVLIGLATIWDMVKYLEKDKDGQYPTTRITDISVKRKVKKEYTRDL